MDRELLRSYFHYQYLVLDFLSKSDIPTVAEAAAAGLLAQEALVKAVFADEIADINSALEALKNRTL